MRSWGSNLRADRPELNGKPGVVTRLTGVTFAMDNTDLTLIVCELKMNTGSAYHFPGAEIDVPPQVRVGRLLSQIPPPRFVFSHKADTFFYSS